MNPFDSSNDYHQTIRELSDRLVEIQRPIRILDAIHWDDSVAQAFIARGAKELPDVGPEYYAKRPLAFDPEAKRQEFQELAQEVHRKLGQFSPVGTILRRMCREYELVVRMLEVRGKPEFSRLSRELYGSAHDVFHAGEPSIADFADTLMEALFNIDNAGHLPAEPKTITGEDAVVVLQERFRDIFPDPDRRVQVIISDGIVADAAAGSDYLKIRKDAMFNERDIRLLEVHEGWVHLGTTYNGEQQPVCTFLSKGPPSSTITQEGLALFMEVHSFACHPARLRRIANRIHGISMAENGANFLEVYNYFREQGANEQEAFTGTARVFRGSTAELGPFTKDISYSKGFVLLYNYVRIAVRKGMLDRVPLLFCGKTVLEDMPALAKLVEEGVVVPPKFLPPQFADLNALSAWMCFSTFVQKLDIDRIEADYANII